MSNEEVLPPKPSPAQLIFPPDFPDVGTPVYAEAAEAVDNTTEKEENDNAAS